MLISVRMLVKKIIWIQLKVVLMVKEIKLIVQQLIVLKKHVFIICLLMNRFVI